MPAILQPRDRRSNFVISLSLNARKATNGLCILGSLACGIATPLPVAAEPSASRWSCAEARIYDRKPVSHSRTPMGRRFRRIFQLPIVPGNDDEERSAWRRTEHGWVPPRSRREASQINGRTPLLG